MYPRLFILIKPKKSQLIGASFTSNTNSGNTDGFVIDELRNFDMSISKTD